MSFMNIGRFPFIAFSITALALTGCASDALIPMPPEKPEIAVAPHVKIDPAETREHRRLLVAFGGEYHHAPSQTIANEIVARLSLATDQPSFKFRVTILNSASINAFALPNGSIYITRGLLALANSTSELSSVIAHEMAHITARHAIERALVERRATLVTRVNADLLNDAQAGETSQNQGRVAIASFSRNQELEADQLGVRMMAKAGYDPYGASRFLKSLEKSAVLRSNTSAKNNPDFFSTHPSTPERIETALKAARQLSVTQDGGQNDRNRYLLTVNGIAFGDDPADGIIKDTVFSHSKLGFTFKAPTGFVLKNSASAVLGLKNNSEQALRFETIRLNSNSGSNSGSNISLTEYLKKSPVEDAPTSRIELLKIEGFEAATAIANSNDWTYRFGVIKDNGRAYRMILAAQNFTPEVDRQFLETLTSFRKLSPNEAQDIRLSKIALVTAEIGDTASSLAERMTGDRKLERFLVLNGLETDQVLVGSLKYKIIT